MVGVARRSLLSFLFAGCVFGVFAVPASADNYFGDLDPAFGTGGIVRTDGPDSNVDAGNSMALLPSGKILVGGYTTTTAGARDFAVARYNGDGTLDTSFGGGDGFATADIQSVSTDQAYGLAVQGDGKIVLVGYTLDNAPGVPYQVAIVRFNDDGTLDSSFDGNSGNGNGIVVVSSDNGLDAYPDDVAVDGSGRIVVVGAEQQTVEDYQADVLVIRLNGSDGTLDTSFDGDSGTGNGLVTVSFSNAQNSYEEAYGVGIGDDGDIIAAGDAYDGSSTDRIGMMKLNSSDGTLDSAFDGNSGNGNGKVTTLIGSDSFANDLVISPGKVTVAGVSDQKFALARYQQSDGTLDTNFSGDGMTADPVDPGHFTYNQANNIAIDGSKYLVAGLASGDGPTGSDMAVARYTGSGYLDQSFGGDGTVTTSTAPKNGGENAHGVAAIDDGNALTDNKVVVAGVTVPPSAQPDIALVRYGPFVAAPVTTITRPKAGTTTDRTPTLKFHVSEQAYSRCRIDTEAWVDPCDSPYNFGRQSFGKHVIRVESTDRAGNVEETPAKRAFKIVR